jgi:hypothetical protein
MISRRDLPLLMAPNAATHHRHDRKRKDGTGLDGTGLEAAVVRVIGFTASQPYLA